MALIELMMLYAAIKAQSFQLAPTPDNLTQWCNAQEIVHDHHNTGKKIAA